MIEVKNVTKEFKKQGRTILLASHNRDDIEMLCDEVYEMDAGILTRQILDLSKV
jgi:ABC-2 type transport system ATP-binding protein